MIEKIKHKFSIKKKTILLFLVFSLLIIMMSSWIFARVIYNYTTDRYTSKLDELTKTVSGTIDAERADLLIEKTKAIYAEAERPVFSDKYGTEEYDKYMSRFSSLTSDPDYIYLRFFMQAIADINDVDCIYIVFVDPVYRGFVYVVDSAREDPCLPGTVDPIYEMNEKVIEHPETGFPPYVTDTEEYGHLMTAGAPLIYDGKIIGYAAADVTFEQVVNERANAVLRFFAYMVASLALFCIVALLAVNFGFVRPVKKLTNAALDYNIRADGKGEENNFSKLKIRTGDEIEYLLGAMKKLESELNDKITKLSETNEELTESRQVAASMTRLANKDSLTGVRNKTAYNAKIVKLDDGLKKGDTKFGIAMIDLNDLKLHNDFYGHDCGDAAIIKLCGIICATFAHSPVYRVGGDEFTVILQNYDYENIEKLVEEFNVKIEAINRDEYIPNKEKITAAIGYALYDADCDLSATDVFKRADSAMYEHKRKMKGFV